MWTIFLYDGEKTKGYVYTCPICGTKSLSALNGMKFQRFKNENSQSEYKYLYMVSCL